VVDRLGAVGTHSQERNGKEGGGDERAEPPHEKPRRRLAAEHPAKEKREAALGAAGSAWKGHCRGHELHHGSSGKAGEEIPVDAEGLEDEPGHHVEAEELTHRDDTRKRHVGYVGRGALKGGRELVHLRVDHLVPVLVVLEPTMPVGEVDGPVAHALHEPRTEADHEEHDELEGVHAKDDEVEKDDVAIRIEKELEAREKHQERKEDERELEHDEAGELRGRRLTHVEARTREAVDLRGHRACHHGREVAKEDTGRLHAHEVAHADGRVVVKPHGNDVGKDAKGEIAKIAEAGKDDPACVDIMKRVDKPRHLPRKDEEEHVDDKDAEDEQGTLPRLLLVLLLGGIRPLTGGGDATGADVYLGLCLLGVCHVSPPWRGDVP